MLMYELSAVNSFVMPKKLKNGIFFIFASSVHCLMLNYIIRQTDIYLKSKVGGNKMLKRLAKKLCVYILAGVVIWFCIITTISGARRKLWYLKPLTAV